MKFNTVKLLKEKICLALMYLMWTAMMDVNNKW